MTKAVRLTTVAEPGSLTPDGPRETGSRPARFSTKPIVAFQKESDIHPNVGTKRPRMTSSSAVRPSARTISSIIAVPRTAVPATAPKKTPLRERRNGMRTGDWAGVGVIWSPWSFRIPDVAPALTHSCLVPDEVESHVGRLTSRRGETKRDAPPGLIRKRGRAHVRNFAGGNIDDGLDHSSLDSHCPIVDLAT